MLRSPVMAAGSPHFSGRVSTLFDQPPLRWQRLGGLPPQQQLRYRSFHPAFREGCVAPTLSARCENQPAFGQVAGNDGSEESQLAAIERFAGTIAPIRAAAPLTPLRDYFPHLPKPPSIVLELAM